MANKRIELEQYKCYVNLFEEEPNRKMVRSGVTILMVGASMLVALVLVLGFLSTNLAKNPGNVLQKPPAATPSTPTGTQQLPNGQLPSGIDTSPVPSNTVPVPTTIPSTSPSGGSVPRGDSGRPAIADFGGLPTEAWSGALVAQAAPSTTGQVPVQDGSTPTTVTAPATPGTTTTTVPSQQTSAASKGPAQQTKGVGNLSNLATKLGQRGLQLFLLGLTLILGILIYMTFSRARKAGKAR